MHWADYQTTAGRRILGVFWIGTRGKCGKLYTHIQLIEVNTHTHTHTHTHTLKHTGNCIHTCTGMHSGLYASYKHTFTVHSTCTVNNSCIWSQCNNADKPRMYIPVTNPCVQYKHREHTPQEHNSIYTRRHVVKINSFSVFIIHIALSLYLLNEMQTMARYSWAWDHIDAGAHTGAAPFINTQEVGLTLLPYPWLNHAYILYLIVWVEGKNTQARKTVMKHHRHGYYRHAARNTNSPCRYLFSSISIHYAAECIIGV